MEEFKKFIHQGEKRSSKWELTKLTKKAMGFLGGNVLPPTSCEREKTVSYLNFW
jgi:hypothetical protein